MVSIKSIIFFAIIFGIILFGYFNYELFSRYFPINIGIKLFMVGIGIIGFFIPQIISKLKAGDDYANIKEFIIEKYKKK